MDWIKKVVLIKKKLSLHGYNDVASRITNAQMVLGTPGEMFLEVMNELLNLKKHSPDTYQIVENEVQELIEYGKSINYFRPREE